MKHKRRWGVLGLILALLLALGLWAGGKGARLWLHPNSLQGTLARLEARANPGALDSLGAADFAALKGDFAALESDLSAVEAEARAFMPLARHLGWVPMFGGDIQAVPELVDVANGVAKAGRLALEGAEPLVAAWQQSSSEASGSLLERVLPALVDAGPRLATAQAELEQVAAARVELDVSRLSPRVGALVERLDRYLPLLRHAVQAAALAPSLLGSEDPRSYLVIAQNNHELRAGGGFISAVVLLRLDQGRYDMAALIRDGGDMLDWHGVVQRAVDWQLVILLQRALAHLEALWPGTVPAGATEEVAVLQPTRAEALVHRWVVDRRRNRTSDVLLFLATLRGRGRRARYLLEQGFPSPAYMRELYCPRRPGLWPLSYLQRAGLTLWYLLPSRSGRPPAPA